MDKLNRFQTSLFIIGFGILFISCEKDVVGNITSNDGMLERSAYIEKGFSEIEVSPIVKENCYFDQWDKEVMTPVSGLFEYYDSDDNWVASIDFGDGTCDEWATKTWDINVFPDYPAGTTTFSVFKYKEKK